MAATSSMRVLRALAMVLEGAGISQVKLLAAIAVDPVLLGDENARLPFERLERAWELASEWTGDECFGLHFAERTAIGEFDVVDYAARSSSNIGEALERVMRYQRILHDAVKIAMTAHHDVVDIVHRIEHGARDVARQAVEAAIASWVLRARTMTGVEIEPVEVRFRHAAPTNLVEHARIFRGPVRFESDSNALVLSRAHLSLPITTSDARLGALLDRHAELILSRLPQHGLAAELRAALTEAMKSGDANLPAIAKRLGMSTRTLQRRLSSEGLKFEEVLECLRRELAFQYLSDLSIGEVAFLLGYSDTTAFHRAFRRWAGCTPQVFQRKANS